MIKQNFVNLLFFFPSVSGFFAFGSRNTNEFFGFEIFLLTDKIAVALERPLGQTQVSVDRDQVTQIFSCVTSLPAKLFSAQEMLKWADYTCNRNEST